MADRPESDEAPRAPTQADLQRIAEALNAHGVRYAVVGGFAMAHHGLLRATEDIDLLLDSSEENVEAVRRALRVLPDQAVLDVRPTDLSEYVVVRVADEVVVDLMGSAGGVTYAEVEEEVEIGDVAGVPVRFLSARALLRTKQTMRPKDVPDRLYLERILSE